MIQAGISIWQQLRLGCGIVECMIGYIARTKT